MADHPAQQGAQSQGADFILMAMVTMAASDGDQSGRMLRPEEITAEAAANGRDGGVLARLSAAAGSLDADTKEEIIRASYLVLLADDRIAGEERKKLQDIAAALKVPEIHFGAILEDLAIWLAAQKA